MIQVKIGWLAEEDLAVVFEIHFAEHGLEDGVEVRDDRVRREEQRMLSCYCLELMKILLV